MLLSGCGPAVRMYAGSPEIEHGHISVVQRVALTAVVCWLRVGVAVMRMASIMLLYTCFGDPGGGRPPLFDGRSWGVYGTAEST